VIDRSDVLVNLLTYLFGYRTRALLGSRSLSCMRFSDECDRMLILKKLYVLKVIEQRNLLRNF